MSYEGDPIGLARDVIAGKVHKQPNGDFYVDHVGQLALAVIEQAAELAQLRQQLSDARLQIDEQPQCPECGKSDELDVTDPIALTAEQAGYRWYCERCNLVFGRREDD